MGTLSEKLQLTLATKKNIKREIEKKGVYVGDAPFSDYPSKIAAVGTDGGWKEEDWADIQQVRLLDTEDYTFKSIYLLDDSNDTIDLQGGDAYKTSDSDELILESGFYSFTGAGDVECIQGYKTRWVMVYKNAARNDHPGIMQNSLLYTIQDGITDLQGFTESVKLRYVDCISDVAGISDSAFKGCRSLVYVNGLQSVTSIGDFAFSHCSSLEGIDSTGGYSVYNSSFSYCTGMKELILRNVTFDSAGNFAHYATIQTLVINQPIGAVPNVKKLVLEEGATLPGVAFNDEVKIEVVNAPSVLTTSSIMSTNKYLLEEVEDNIKVSADCYHRIPSLRKLKMTGTISSSSYTVGAECENLKELEAPSFLFFWTYSSPLLETVEAPLAQFVRLYDLPSLLSVSFPEATEAISMYGLGKCTTIDMPKLQTASSFSFMYDNASLESISFPLFIGTGSSTSSQSYFYNLPKCKTIDLPSLVKLQNQGFYDLPSLESISLPVFTGVNTGTFTGFNNLGITHLSLPSFTSQLNGINDCPELLSVNLPLCPFVAGVNRCAKLAEFHADKATGLNGFTDLPSIETIEAPLVTSISSFHGMPSLKNLDLPSLKNASSGVLYSLGLETLSLPSLTTITGVNNGTALVFTDMPNLTEVHLPELTTVTYAKSTWSPFFKLGSLKVFDAPKLATLYPYFLSESGLEEYTVSNVVTSIQANAFYKMPYLRRLTFAEGYNGKFSSSYLFQYTAYQCPNLEYVYLPASITMADTTQTYDYCHIGAGCPKLATVELGQGYSKTLYLKHITTLTKECVVNMLNALADLTGGSKQTLYIYSETLALLSDEEKAIATNKNWTLAS